jgi:hypothetical protein
MIISAGNNIKIQKVGEDYLISSETTVFSKGFKLTSESIEIIGERGIMISSAMPNKIVISVDINKYIAEIQDLQTRFYNLEKLFLERISK